MTVGPWQILLILLIVLILFGAGRLPQVMRDIGKGFKSFKQELNRDSSDVDTIDNDQEKK